MKPSSSRAFVVRSVIPANQISQRITKSIRFFPPSSSTKQINKGSGGDSLVFREKSQFGVYYTPPRRRQQQKKRKFNSTDSMFIKNDLHQPDLDMIIRCISRAISKKVREGSYSLEKKLLCLFEEDFRGNNSIIHGSSSGSYNCKKNLTTNIFEMANLFLYMVFDTVGLSPEIAVISVIYVDRLIESTRLTFNISNWKKIVFTAILLSAKAWEELAVWNEDFLIFPGWVSLSTISLMERQFLKHIKFDLGIQPSVYTNYYLQLRSFADVSEDFPVIPHDRKNIRSKLDRRSKNRVTLHRSRCTSVDSWEGYEYQSLFHKLKKEN